MRDTDLSLTGVHDVDWLSLGGGSAVPRMLTALVGGNPAARTTAMRNLCRIAPDGEDVRPWVPAALPVLLELVADPARPDRGPILRLIGDLAGADRTWQMAGETLRAKKVLAGSGRLTGLLTDEDPAVRDAAAYTVRAVSRLTSGLPELLWERYVEEPDPVVRATLLRSAVITGSVGTGHQATKTWLAWVADSDNDLRVRVTALTELMELLDPPPFDAEIARDTLLAAYREGLNRAPAPLDDEVAPLLTGRRMAARQWTPGYHQVVIAVRALYRNDVGAHLDLLERMLALDAWDARQDALYEALPLMQRLRGPYQPLVARAAELLHSGDPQLRAAALRLLSGIGEIARPTADAVWAVLADADPRIRPGHPNVWVQRGALGPAVQTLAELRDDRVLPALERLLDDAADTEGLHRYIAGYGVRARGLSRTLRRHLRSLPPYATEAYRAGLLHALVAVAPNEAADHLAGEPIDLTTLGLLASAGRAAAGRVPDIRAALTGTGPAMELAAARAIWRVAGDAEAAAAVYDRFFDDRYSGARHAVLAIDGYGELGIRVADRARLLARRRSARTDGEVVVAAADALWRIAGERKPARALGRVWEAVPRLRPRIAGLWVRTGDGRYGARYARAELDTVVRHNVSNLGLPAAEVSADERLLALCRELVAPVG